jgi:hypothetical protein
MDVERGKPHVHHRSIGRPSLDLMLPVAACEDRSDEVRRPMRVCNTAALPTMVDCRE